MTTASLWLPLLLLLAATVLVVLPPTVSAEGTAVLNEIRSGSELPVNFWDDLSAPAATIATVQANSIELSQQFALLINTPVVVLDASKSVSVSGGVGASLESAGDLNALSQNAVVVSADSARLWSTSTFILESTSGNVAVQAGDDAKLHANTVTLVATGVSVSATGPLQIISDHLLAGFTAASMQMQSGGDVEFLARDGSIDAVSAKALTLSGSRAQLIGVQGAVLRAQSLSFSSTDRLQFDGETVHMISANKLALSAAGSLVIESVSDTVVSGASVKLLGSSVNISSALGLHVVNEFDIQLASTLSQSHLSDVMRLFSEHVDFNAASDATAQRVFLGHYDDLLTERLSSDSFTVTSNTLQLDSRDAVTSLGAQISISSAQFRADSRGRSLFVSEDFLVASDSVVAFDAGTQSNLYFDAESALLTATGSFSAEAGTTAAFSSTNATAVAVGIDGALFQSSQGQQVSLGGESIVLLARLQSFTIDAANLYAKASRDVTAYAGQQDLTGSGYAAFHAVSDFTLDAATGSISLTADQLLSFSAVDRSALLSLVASGTWQISSFEGATPLRFTGGVGVISGSPLEVAFTERLTMDSYDAVTLSAENFTLTSGAIARVNSSAVAIAAASKLSLLAPDVLLQGSTVSAVSGGNITGSFNALRVVGEGSADVRTSKDLRIVTGSFDSWNAEEALMLSAQRNLTLSGSAGTKIASVGWMRAALGGSTMVRANTTGGIIEVSAVETALIESTRAGATLSATAALTVTGGAVLLESGFLVGDVSLTGTAGSVTVDATAGAPPRLVAIDSRTAALLAGTSATLSGGSAYVSASSMDLLNAIGGLSVTAGDTVVISALSYHANAEHTAELRGDLGLLVASGIDKGVTVTSAKALTFTSSSTIDLAADSSVLVTAYNSSQLLASEISLQGDDKVVVAAERNLLWSAAGTLSVENGGAVLLESIGGDGFDVVFDAQDSLTGGAANSFSIIGAGVGADQRCGVLLDAFQQGGASSITGATVLLEGERSVQWSVGDDLSLPAERNALWSATDGAIVLTSYSGAAPAVELAANHAEHGIVEVLARRAGVLLNASSVTLEANATVSAAAVRGVALLSESGSSIDATNNVLLAGARGLNISGGSASPRVEADLTVNAQDTISFEAPAAVQFSGGVGGLSVTASTIDVLSEEGNDVRLTSARDMTLTSTGTLEAIVLYGDVTLRSRAGAVAANVIAGTATLTASAGPVQFEAFGNGAALTFASGGDVSVDAGGDMYLTAASTFAISASDVVLDAQTDVRVLANRAVDAVRINSANDARVTARGLLDDDLLSLSGNHLNVVGISGVYLQTLGPATLGTSRAPTITVQAGLDAQQVGVQLTAASGAIVVDTPRSVLAFANFGASLSAAQRVQLRSADDVEFFVSGSAPLTLEASERVTLTSRDASVSGISTDASAQTLLSLASVGTDDDARIEFSSPLQQLTANDVGFASETFAFDRGDVQTATFTASQLRVRAASPLPRDDEEHRGGMSLAAALLMQVTATSPVTVGTTGNDAPLSFATTARDSGLTWHVNDVTSDVAFSTLGELSDIVLRGTSVSLVSQPGVASGNVVLSARDPEPGSFRGAFSVAADGDVHVSSDSAGLYVTAGFDLTFETLRLYSSLTMSAGLTNGPLTVTAFDALTFDTDPEFDGSILVSSSKVITLDSTAGDVQLSAVDLSINSYATFTQAITGAWELQLLESLVFDSPSATPMQLETTQGGMRLAAIGANANFNVIATDTKFAATSLIDMSGGAVSVESLDTVTVEGDTFVAELPHLTVESTFGTLSLGSSGKLRFESQGSDLKELAGTHFYGDTTFLVTEDVSALIAGNIAFDAGSSGGGIELTSTDGNVILLSHSPSGVSRLSYGDITFTVDDAYLTAGTSLSITTQIGGDIQIDTSTTLTVESHGVTIVSHATAQLGQIGQSTDAITATSTDQMYLSATSLVLDASYHGTLPSSMNKFSGTTTSMSGSVASLAATSGSVEFNVATKYSVTADEFHLTGRSGSVTSVDELTVFGELSMQVEDSLYIHNANFITMDVEGASVVALGTESSNGIHFESSAVLSLNADDDIDIFSSGNMNFVSGSAFHFHQDSGDDLFVTVQDYVDLHGDFVEIDADFIDLISYESVHFTAVDDIRMGGDVTYASRFFSANHRLGFFSFAPSAQHIMSPFRHSVCVNMGFCGLLPYSQGNSLWSVFERVEGLVGDLNDHALNWQLFLYDDGTGQI